MSGMAFPGCRICRRFQGEGHDLSKHEEQARAEGIIIGRTLERSATRVYLFGDGLRGFSGSGRGRAFYWYETIADDLNRGYHDENEPPLAMVFDELDEAARRLCGIARDVPKPAPVTHAADCPLTQGAGITEEWELGCTCRG